MRLWGTEKKGQKKNSTLTRNIRSHNKLAHWSKKTSASHKPLESTRSAVMNSNLSPAPQCVISSLFRSKNIPRQVEKRGKNIRILIASDAVNAAVVYLERK